jgi:6-phosphogluconolactonase
MLEDCIALVSNAEDGDIAAYGFGASAPALRTVERHRVGTHVMPLAVGADRQTVFAAARGAAPALVKCTLDTLTGHLTTDYRVAIDASIVALALDRTDRFLFGAAYGGHEVVVYSVAGLDRGDPKPVQTLRGVRNAHSVVVTGDNRFAYVTSLANDEILCCSIDVNLAQPLGMIETATLDRGFGPRHMSLSPDGKWLYVLSEFRATVAVFRRDADSGKLALHSVSARPSVLAGMLDGFVRPPATDPQPDPATLTSLIWAADIHVRPDGQFVYISERTTNRILVLRVTLNGALEHASHFDTEAQPRGFSIDPSGRLLLACGEKSTQVSLYGIDAKSGALTLHSRARGGRGANWVKIVPRE